MGGGSGYDHPSPSIPLPVEGRGKSRATLPGILGAWAASDPLPIKREPPVVDEVALRLRLPAEQALCGAASPRACA